MAYNQDMNVNINMSFPRLESGFKIMDKVKMVSPLRAVVQSSTDKNKYYSVDLKMSECDCPDFMYRGVKCKHLRAAEAKVGMYVK